MNGPYTLEEFTDEAKRFLTTLKKDNTTATVLALYGDLGTGKTTFAQILARELGIKDHIVSPTFIIQKRYPLSASNSYWRLLVHIDAYRLKNVEQLRVLEWDELVENPQNLIIIEWPEKMGELLPASTHRIGFTYIDDTTRSISYKQ